MDPAALFDGGAVTLELVLLMSLPLGLLLLLWALLSGDGGRRRLARRIEHVKANHERTPAAAAAFISARRRTHSSSIPGLEDLIKRLMPRQDMLRLRLARAGLEISLGVYVLTSFVVAGIAFVLCKNAFAMPVVLAGLGAVFWGLALPHLFVGWRIRRRQTRFIDYFPEAIDLMVRGIRAGLPIGESIKTAGEEVPDPVGSELNRITDGVRIGRKLDEILWETSHRLDIQEFKFFTIALSIQSETGGNLAETLSNLADVLRGRRQLKRKVKALSSEAKASAYIIGSLPFIMTGLIYLVNNEYIMGLFTDVRGQFLIGFGLFMIAAGAGVMYRMVKFEL